MLKTALAVVQPNQVPPNLRKAYFVDADEIAELLKV